MHLSQLRRIVAIVEAGSIRAAARAQGVSHPALTKSLRLLEGEVGLSLIRRSTHGVACTPAGRALLARARAILTEVRKANEELAQLATPGGGTLGVGLSSTAAAVAPKAIVRFLQDHPDARLRIMEGPQSVLLPLVRDETLDFAVLQRTLGAIAPGLKFRALYRDRMVITGRRGHPLRGAGSLRELAEARWLGFNAPGSGGWLEQAFAEAGLSFPRRFILCESFAFAFALMSQTDSVMPVPAPVLAGYQNRGLLVEIPVKEPLPLFVIGLCTRAETRLTPLAATLARVVADCIRGIEQAR